MEDVFETTVVGLQNRVLRREINRVIPGKTIVERCPREIADRLIEVIHCHRNATAGCLEDLEALGFGAISGLEANRQRSRAVKDKVRCPVLVTKRVTANNNRLVPTRNQPRDVGNDDGLAENHSAQDVANGSIGAAPHLLEAKLFDSRLVRSNGCALDANPVLLDGVSGIDGDLVIGLVALFDAEVVVLERQIEVRVNEAVLDELPNDARHFVAIEFNDNALNLNFFHSFVLSTTSPAPPPPV